MTYTTQSLSPPSIENADNTEAESTIRDTLAVCDSLNKLHETLRRLDYAVKRKKIEKSLSEKKPFAPKKNSTKRPDFNQCVILNVLAAVMITVVSLLFLNFTFSKTVRNNIGLLNNIADEQADYWQSILERRLTQIHTIAAILESYGSEPAEIRQHRSDSTLESITTKNDEIVALYTLWNPDAVWGLGQYAAEYTGGSKQFEIIPAESTGGRNAYLLNMTAPIFNPDTGEMSGVLFCAYDLAITQKTLEKVMAENNFINFMEIYTNNGYIAASHVSNRIGKNLSNAEPINSNMRMAAKPFTAGNETWLVMLGATEELFLRGMNESIRLTIIAALIATVTASAAIFIIFSIMKKPAGQGKNGGLTTPKKYQAW